MPDNPLSKYLDRRDLLKAVASLQSKQGTTKDGTPYYYLEVGLINGFHTRIFLKSGEDFGWCNAFDQIETENQIEF